MTDEQRDRVRLLGRIAPVFALIYAVFWIFNLDLSHAIPRDGTTLVVGRDFLNTWMVGHIAWDPNPARFYELATYQAEVAKWTGPNYLGQVWSYPPSVMLIGAPLALMPYVAALAVWTVIGPIVFIAALRCWTKDVYVLLAALFCPAAIFGIISGQYAYLAAALILTVLRWRQSRPFAAGLLLGLLTMKPQLGLFFPFMLIAARDWRVIAGAIISTAGLVGLTALIWGVAPWIAYLTTGIETQSAVLSDPINTVAPFMPTIFVGLRSAGLAVNVASGLQLAIAAAAAAAIVWRFSSQPSADDRRANAFFLTAATSGTAYMMTYDTLAMTTAVLLACLAGNAGRWLTFGIYFLTLIQIVLGTAGVPGAALLPVATAIFLLRQWRAETSECPSAPVNFKAV